MSEWRPGLRWVAPLTGVLMGLSIGCARHSPEPAPVTVRAESPDYYAAAAERTEVLLERLERNYGPHDPRLITPLMSLSMAYFRLDRIEESDALLERAWELLESDPELTIEDVDFPVRYGTLVMAARQGNRLDARTHLAQGADVNQRDADGRTPLHYFAAQGDEEMVRTLLRQGAAVGARDWQGHTASDLAEEQEHAGIVDMLARRQAGEQPADAPGDAPPDQPPGDDFFGAPDAPAQDDFFGTPEPSQDDDFFQQPDAVDDDFFF